MWAEVAVEDWLMTPEEKMAKGVLERTLSLAFG
jgi:hypothetical protein